MATYGHTDILIDLLRIFEYKIDHISKNKDTQNRIFFLHKFLHIAHFFYANMATFEGGWGVNYMSLVEIEKHKPQKFMTSPVTALKVENAQTKKMHRLSEKLASLGIM